MVKPIQGYPIPVDRKGAANKLFDPWPLVCMVCDPLLCGIELTPNSLKVAHSRIRSFGIELSPNLQTVIRPTKIQIAFVFVGAGFGMDFGNPSGLGLTLTAWEVLC